MFPPYYLIKYHILSDQISYIIESITFNKDNNNDNKSVKLSPSLLIYSGQYNEIIDIINKSLIDYDTHFKNYSDKSSTQLFYLTQIKFKYDLCNKYLIMPTFRNKQSDGGDIYYLDIISLI